MAVYVDKARHSFGRMVMCHMLADTLDELHAMADRIGVARRWFQNKRTPHYDVCLAKRALAIQNGAIECEREKVAELVKRWVRERRLEFRQNCRLRQWKQEGPDVCGFDRGLWQPCPPETGCPRPR